MTLKLNNAIYFRKFDKYTHAVDSAKREHANVSPICIIFVCIVYLYSAQYLHVLQDSKHYLIHPTAHAQLSSYLHFLN